MRVYPVKPKKSLGQNFLEDKVALKKIAAALALERGETVIEIGPGHGELTGELLKFPVSVIAIEKDDRFAAPLQQKFQMPNAKCQIMNSDVLRVLPELVGNLKFGIGHSNYKVVGNIPYYITGHLLRILSELEPKPRKIVLMVQKEVAERVCANPPRTNLLSASVQFWAKPHILFRVSRNSFRPAPKVDSAVIEMTPLKRTAIKPDVFYPFITKLFSQPRKTILNNLAMGDKRPVIRAELAEKLERLGVDPSARPQNLSLADIVELAERLK